MKCPVCKTPMEQEMANLTENVNGEDVLIEDVPLWVCPQCDETVMDDAVLAAIEDMLYGLQEGIAADEEIS
ncbi:MAG: YgiT-type zinc finger protein [Chloroflexi bacterium]|nr:YgiT-type zinc finger protein [Chloroflexota bacterium]